MPKRNTQYYATVYALDVATGLGKTADAGNINLFVSKDGGAPAAVTNAITEPSGTNAPGNYQVLLTASEMDAESIEVSGFSSTSGVNVYPKSITTTMDANLTQIDGELTVGNNAVLSLKRLDLLNDTSAGAFNVYNSAGGPAASFAHASGSTLEFGRSDAPIRVNNSAGGNGIDINAANGNAVNAIGSDIGIFASGGDVGIKGFGDNIGINGASSDGPGIQGDSNGTAQAGIYSVSNNGDGFRAWAINPAYKDINAKEIGDVVSVNGNAVTSPDDFKADLTGVALEASVQQIVSKLPLGTISDLSLTSEVDGSTLNYIYELMMAMANGRYEIDDPVAGNVTFYKRDNVTVLTTVNVSNVNRTREA